MSEIRRGCTPVICYELLDKDDAPFDMSLIKNMTLTLSQFDKVIVKKEMIDLTVKENVVSYTLTQEDTLKISTNTFVEIQLKLQLLSGLVYATDVSKRSAKQILDEVPFND